MNKHKKKFGKARPIWLVLVGLCSLGLLITVLLHGTNIALFNPKGFIANEQHRLMLFSVALLLDIGIPTLLLFYFIAWKYRESNEKATYDPNVHHGKSFVFIIWAVPTIFMLLLASIMWPATHKLAPKQAITADVKPLTIEVVAMRWKWLFIYPEQGIASVNFAQIPTDTPVEFVLTADETPMSSFWIPQLGGQLYAMTGHVNQLNLMAETSGDYAGRSAEINGAGFAGMKFITRAGSIEDFDQWVQSTKSSSDVLNSTEYNKLLSPSENNPVTVYSQAEPNLYSNLLAKYNYNELHSQHTEHK
jgi:cytochrome o ubiquinol oxidase subunit 2